MNHLIVAELMNTHPVTFDTDMTLPAAVDLLVQSKHYGGPVLDAQRRLVGFLSEQDCIQRMLLASYHDEGISLVRDIMQTEFPTARPEQPIADVAQQMLIGKPGHFVVVGEQGEMLGVIHRGDVLLALDKELHSHYRQSA